jgi:hypothetical protein
MPTLHYGKDKELHYHHKRKLRTPDLLTRSGYNYGHTIYFMDKRNRDLAYQNAVGVVVHDEPRFWSDSALLSHPKM